MNTDDIKNTAQDVYEENQTSNQFAVSQPPYHTHNGSDSQSINFKNLIGRYEFLNEVLPGTSAATSGNYGVIFIAPYSCVFVGATEVHSTAGSDANSVFLQIEKLTSTTATGSGTSLLFSNPGILTASVAAGGVNYAVNDTITLTGGTAGTQAILKVLTITGSAVATVSIQNPGNYSVFPSNPVSQGSSSGAGTGATFNITFTNNGFNLKSTANTVQTGILALLPKNRFNLKKGDRLGLSLKGTPTAVSQVCVIIQLNY